jgi:predicted transcriptional regulator
MFFFKENYEAHTHILESSIIKRLQSLGYKVQTYKYMRFNIIVAQQQKWSWM